MKYQSASMQSDTCLSVAEKNMHSKPISKLFGLIVSRWKNTYCGRDFWEDSVQWTISMLPLTLLTTQGTNIFLWAFKLLRSSRESMGILFLSASIAPPFWNGSNFEEIFVLLEWCMSLNPGQHQVKSPSLAAGHPYTPTSFIRREFCCGWQDTESWTNVPFEGSLA